MSLHAEDWARVIEEVKKNLPWFLDLFHSLQTQKIDPKVEVITVLPPKNGSKAEVVSSGEVTPFRPTV